MKKNNDERLPADLEEVAQRLRTERPTLTPLELDGIKLEARTRASRATERSRKKGSFMRSRLAITMLLVLGMLMSGTGAALSVSGVSGSGSSGDAQYPTTPTQTVTPPPTQAVDPTTETGGDTPTDKTSTPPIEAQQVQAENQVSTSDTLPFTGFAAIPVLLGGLVLLGAGLVLRRGSKSGEQS